MEKKYIKFLVLIQLVILVCIAVLNYVVDPLLYYQRDWRVFPPLYTEEQRYLLPGLIKNSPGHNTAIMGSSMAGNFIASEVGKLLNQKTLKLTIDGATLKEQSFVLSKYLETHPNAKTIIWGIDPEFIYNDPEVMILQKFSFPYYLYEDTLLNFQYLVNYDVTVHSLQTVINDIFGINFLMKKKELDLIHTWPTETLTGCEQVIKHYNLVKEERNIHWIVRDYNQEHITPNINKIVALAEQYKGVNFYLFLPPKSIVFHYIFYEHNTLEPILEARNLIAEKTKEMNNIKIVDLQTSEDIIFNLDYYKDMPHYNRTINNIILKQIINNIFDEHESVMKKTNKLRSLVASFDFNKTAECRP